MKKRFLAFFATIVSAIALFTLCACGGNGDGGNPTPPPSGETNPFTMIEGLWVVDEIEVAPAGETLENYTTPKDEYYLRIADDGSFEFVVASASLSYEGTIEAEDQAGYFTFSCKMHETTVINANAYCDSNTRQLTFSEIRFEAGIPSFNYISCRCIPSSTPV